MIGVSSMFWKIFAIVALVCVVALGGMYIMSNRYDIQDYNVIDKWTGRTTHVRDARRN